MDFNDLQIAPPKHWPQFEDLCLDVFKCEWRDKNAVKNGRAGQAQTGTDVSGRPDTAAGKYHGVQCKGKTAAYGAKVTKAELLAEIEKAKSFDPPLAHWILATTAPKDAEIEEIARQLSEEHAAKGLFTVQVMGWEDLQAKINLYDEVIDTHFPNQSRRLRRALRRLQEGIDALGSGATRSAEELFALGMDAAKKDLAGFKKGTPAKLIELGLEVLGAEGRSTSFDEIAEQLASGKSIQLEAEPGAGKTSTVLKLAERICGGNSIIVPVIVPLAEFAEGNRELLDDVASRASFQGLKPSELARLAEFGHLALLCDGWNEIPTEKRPAVFAKIGKFIRESSSGVLVATRPLSPFPVGVSMRVGISPLTRAQQLALLETRIGDKAERLLIAARQVPGLRDVLRNPLYVDALALIGADGQMPVSKEQVIDRFVESGEREPKHREPLVQLLKERHAEYLVALARQLTEIEATTISDTDARRLFADVSERLVADRQLTSAPDVTRIAPTLVDHHLLVERITPQGKFYAFQHQQFQEWYASFAVDSVLRLASKKHDAPEYQERDALIDRQQWEEPLLFAVERLARGSEDDARACASLVMRTLGFDPMLSAEMLQRASDSIWALVAKDIQQFAREWQAEDSTDRAIAFMAAIGRAEFADDFWRFLERDQTRGFRTFEIGPAILGDNWAEKLMKLSRERRRAVLWDIGFSGSQAGIDFVVEAMRGIAAEDVWRAGFEILESRAADADIERALEKASPEFWTYLARRYRLEDLPVTQRQRLRTEKQELLKSLPSGLDKLRLMLSADYDGIEVSPAELVDEALNANYGDDYGFHTQVVQEVAEKWPAELSKAATARIIADKPVHLSVMRQVAAKPGPEQEKLLGIAASARGRNGISRRAELAAHFLDAASATTLISELQARKRSLFGKEGAELTRLREECAALADALANVPFSSLVDGLLAATPREPIEYATLAELLYRWRDLDRQSEELPWLDGQKARIEEAVQHWVDELIAHVDVARTHLADFATAIKRIGSIELLPNLKRLLDQDIAMAKAEEEARKKALAERKRPAVRMSYTNMYWQAFDALKGEQVRDLLIAYIGEPLFEISAASALRKYEKGPALDADAAGLGRISYGVIAAARSAGRSLSATAEPITSLLLNRVDQLLATGDPKDISAAVSLATAAAQMQYGDRASTLVAAVSSAGPRHARMGLIRSLLFAGERIESGWLKDGFEETLQAHQENYGNQDFWWRFREWLELYAFTDEPRDVLELVARLPNGLKKFYDVRDIADAISYASKDQIVILTGLAELCPEILQADEWFEAFERVGTAEAADHLIDFLFDPKFVGSDRYRRHLSDPLEALLRRYPEKGKSIIARLDDKTPKASREVIAQIVYKGTDRETFIGLMDRVAGPGDPIRGALLRAVNEMAMTIKPIEGRSGAYENEAVDLSSLRAELFDIAAERTERGKLAAEMLLQIDLGRDMFGKHRSEARHPNRKAGRAWPPSAEPYWNA